MELKAKTTIHNITLTLKGSELWQFHFILANSVEYYKKRNDLREDERQALELAERLLDKMEKVNNFGIIELETI